MKERIRSAFLMTLTKSSSLSVSFDQ